MNPATFNYVLREGRCQVSFNDVKVGEIGPTEGFGEEALVSGYPRNATVQMVEDGILMRLSKKDFDQLLVPPLIRTISVPEAIDMAHAGAILVDVRTREEYKHNRLGRSINLPLSILRLKFKKLEGHMERPIIVYCDSGVRSSVGSFLLKQAGYDVYKLDNPQKAFRVMKAKKDIRCY